MLITPDTVDFAPWQHLCNGIVLGIGSICTFVFFAYVYAKSGSMWVTSLVHAVFNNGSRSLAYFVTIDSQLSANLGLTITMITVVAFLYFRHEFNVIEKFLSEDPDIA